MRACRNRRVNLAHSRGCGLSAPRAAAAHDQAATTWLCADTRGIEAARAAALARQWARHCTLYRVATWRAVLLYHVAAAPLARQLDAPLHLVIELFRALSLQVVPPSILAASSAHSTANLHDRVAGCAPTLACAQSGIRPPACARPTVPDSSLCFLQYIAVLREGKLVGLVRRLDLVTHVAFYEELEARQREHEREMQTEMIVPEESWLGGNPVGQSTKISRSD